MTDDEIQKRLMNENGQDVADYCGVSRSMICRIRRGNRKAGPDLKKRLHKYYYGGGKVHGLPMNGGGYRHAV